MKRAQSVEVLSVLSEASPRVGRALGHPRGEEEEEEEETFYQASGPPPQESPPPLPPREREAPPVLSVLHSSPALVNDSLVLVEKAAVSPARPQNKAALAPR